MKKGAVSYLNTLILAVVVLIVMLTLTKIVTDSLSSSAKIGKCSASLLKASITEKLTAGVAGLLDLSCNNLPDLTIKKSDVSVNNKIKDDAVKKVIADKMIECWKMAGKGLIDPYKKYDGDQTYCLICSDIIFEKNFVEAAKEQNYNINDNIYWLATTPMPGLKTTYFEDLFGVKPESKIVNDFRNKEIPIDVSQQYAVVWRMETIKTKLAATLSAGIIGGSVVGTYVGKLGGALGGSAIGTLFLGPFGAIIGGAAGAGVGAAAGTYGAVKITQIVNNVGTVSSQILVVPKKQLGEKVVFDLEPDSEEKDFCTRLVNY